MRSSSSSTLHIVRMARLSTEVNTMSGLMPAFLISAPADFASMRPRSDRSTSCQPVKRFSTFQVLWPCRTRINLPGMRAPPLGEGNLSGSLAEMRVETRFAALAAFAARVGEQGKVRGQRGARCGRVVQVKGNAAEHQ